MTACVPELCPHWLTPHSASLLPVDLKLSKVRTFWKAHCQFPSSQATVKPEVYSQASSPHPKMSLNEVVQTE